MSTAFPVELWSRIFTSLRRSSDSSLGFTYAYYVHPDDRRDAAFEALKVCCLVSRTFRQVARPMLFEIMRLGDFAAPSTTRTSRFLEVLNVLLGSDPEIKYWIKDVRVKARNLPGLWNDHRSPRQTRSDMVDRILLQLPNIRKASFEHYMLTGPIYDHLCCSTNFVELRLTDVLMETTTSRPTFPFQRAPLRSLELWGELDETQMQQLCPAIQHMSFGPSLERLQIRYSYVYHMISNMDNLPVDDLSGLHELTLTCDGVIPHAALLTLLSRCSALRTLRFYPIADGADSPADINIPRHYFPQLHSFLGDHVSVDSFISGRPVQKIKLTVEPPQEEIRHIDGIFLQSALGATAAPLRVLYLELRGAEWTNTTFQDISTLFPDLESLGVRFLARRWGSLGRAADAAELLKDLSPLPKLHDFLFIDLRANYGLLRMISKEEEANDRKLAARLVGVWPNLRTMSNRLGKLWKRSDEGEWSVLLGPYVTRRTV